MKEMLDEDLKAVKGVEPETAEKLKRALEIFESSPPYASSKKERPHENGY